MRKAKTNKLLNLGRVEGSKADKIADAKQATKMKPARGKPCK